MNDCCYHPFHNTYGCPWEVKLTYSISCTSVHTHGLDREALQKALTIHLCSCMTCHLKTSQSIEGRARETQTSASDAANYCSLVRGLHYPYYLSNTHNANSIPFKLF